MADAVLAPLRSSRHAGKFKAAVDVSEEAAEHTLEMYGKGRPEGRARRSP